MVKQQDIADRLNISRATVVRALDPNGKVKPETRELVLKVAEELGYKKNVLSSSLASKKQKVVYVFLVKSVNERYAADMKRGLDKIREELIDYNYQIEIIETDINNPEYQIEELRKVLSFSPDGIIITPLLKDEINSLICNNTNIPFISLDIDIDNSIFHVGPDYYKSGKIIAELIAKFLREGEEVLILDTVDDKISSKLYLSGVIDCLNSYSIKYQGPIFSNNPVMELDCILKNHLTVKIKAVFSSRFLNNIVPKLNSMGYKDLIAVGNGLSKQTQILINNGGFAATVVEDNFNAGYLAGKFMFDYLYNGRLNTEKYTTAPSIVIKENIHNYI